MTEKDTYYVVNISIDTDDDFRLDIDYDISTQADSLQEACDKMVQVLKEAKVTWFSTSSIIFTNTDGVEERKEYSKEDIWYDIRDRSIRRLRRGILPFQTGGNQTIECTALERSRSEDAELAAAKAKLTECELFLLGAPLGKYVSTRVGPSWDWPWVPGEGS